ncbi:MAG: D-lyxose/D-mannose family sugar isomerase [Anaerolineae bacterium]|nr:D-lyxose/D-mannose family sugar isomerase [Anaerolineae bacterium]
MITRAEYESAKRRAAEIIRCAEILATPDELDRIEVVDLGLGELEQTGLQILTLVSTSEIGVKVLALFPNQCFAQHKHPPLGDYPGKEETFRCQWGELYLYQPGPPAIAPQAKPPAHRRHTYTVWHEDVLAPGDQVTSPPDTFHWFQAGPEGAVVWSFSSRTTDVQDVFVDPDVSRMTIISNK